MARQNLTVGTLAIDAAELWSIIGLGILTVLLILPGLAYAAYVLNIWIGDSNSYSHVIASIEKH